MQCMSKHMQLIWRIASKEITLFFASPTAYLFLAVFGSTSLFIFFWGESFFSRNIADIRPLFEWMPILLLFLTSTLTMRLWSEERRTGTLEHSSTLPSRQNSMRTSLDKAARQKKPPSSINSWPELTTWRPPR